MGKLEGKVALVTGATSGMGRAMAELFALEGAAVIVSGRNRSLGGEIVKAITGRGGIADFTAADVRNEKDNIRLVKSAVDRYGKLDIMIPNAGVLGLGSVTEISVKSWMDTLDTNLNSLFYLLQAGIPEMKADGGRIVVTGSIAAEKGFPNHAAYCASKGAVESLVRQIAVDYAPDIRINLIRPGAVDTRLYRESAIAFPDPDTVLDEVPASLPMKRIGLPEDIARLALFLASDDSSWMTGSVVTLDGGASAAG